jgi:lipoyl(octanoyl) transferase
MADRPITLYRFGIREYRDAWNWQQETAAAVRNGSRPEAIALLQHPPVFTLGRRARSENLLADPADLLTQGADIVEVDRGGDITFHGPGQLVCYPILDLRRRGFGPVEYVRTLEAVIIATLAEFGIVGERVPGFPGAWAGGAKIAAIGVRIQGGVSTHGFALNVAPDLSWFDAIVPCGIDGVSVTSMTALLGDRTDLLAVENAVLVAFSRAFDSHLVLDTVSEDSRTTASVAHGS